MPIVWRQDNGVGGFEDALGVPHGGFASINYATGALSFNPTVIGQFPLASYEPIKIGTEGVVDLLVAGVDTTGLDADETVDVYRNQLKAIEYVNTPSFFPPVNSWVKARYATSDSATSRTETIEWDTIEVDVTPDYAEQVVGGSLRLNFGGKVLLDRLGTIVTDLNVSNGAATAVGDIDYGSGRVVLESWTPGAANSGTVEALLTNVAGQPVDTTTFRVPAIPVRPSSFIMQFTILGETGINTVAANASGEIDGANVYGNIDYATGIVRVRFGSWVTAAGNEAQWWYQADGIINGKVFKPKMCYADMIRYACVSYSYLPLDEDVLGLNPVRLPSDGRVVVFKPGDVLVVHNTAHIVGTYNNQSVNLGRTRVARVRVFDDERLPVGTHSVQFSGLSGGLFEPGKTLTWATGSGRITRIINDQCWFDAMAGVAPLNGAALACGNCTGGPTATAAADAVVRWEADLDAGTVQIGAMTGIPQPIDIEHRIEDMGLCSDAQINGMLTVTRPITHDYPSPGSHVSSALIIGDMMARYTGLFEQTSWDGVWSDDLRGSQPTASYNDAIFPVLVDNAGAIQERWALIFTSTTQVRVVGETVGQIAEAQSIANIIAPNNPATGRPYFTVNPGGWGSGWASGNVLRFNTIASNFPVWIARTIQQGPATEDSDSFCIQIRGDIDRV